MDPGIKLLRQLKTVPNLISEDPSVVTPESQKSFMDLPWESFSRLLTEKKFSPVGSPASRSQENLAVVPSDEDDTVLAANWDGMTGAQGLAIQ